MSSVENLNLYYEYLYPYEAIVQWLTYNGTKPLNHRELSFQYQTNAVQRYVVFNDANSMRQRMTSRFQQIPIKVDAGAIWSEIPKKDSPGRTQQRQLIFDFDMNDYDDVRNCCQGKKVCVKCWKLLIVAIQVIRVTLQEDFDLHNFMYVFSGGRGVHIWVCDQKARKLKDSVRRNLVDYLELVTGNDKADSMLAENVIKPVDKFIGILGNRKEMLSDKRSLKRHFINQNCHYHVQRSLQIIQKQNFLQIFKEQTALQHQKGRDIVLKILKSRSEKLKNRVSERWQKSFNKDTQSLYKIVEEQVNLYEQGQIVNRNNIDYPMQKAPRYTEYKNLTFIEQEIMLTFLYPRMDYNVSTSQNHLLKLPFSIHPTSQKVSVPIFPESVRSFDPDDVAIKFENLIKQLHELSTQHGVNNLNRQIAMLNSPLNPFIRNMSDFVEQVCRK